MLAKPKAFAFFFPVASCGEETERFHMKRWLTGVPEEADEVFREENSSRHFLL